MMKVVLTVTLLQDYSATEMQDKVEARLENLAHNSIVEHYPGLKWKMIGSEKPAKGSELENEALASALQYKVEFTMEELDQIFDHKLQSAALSYECFIKVLDQYFQPAEPQEKRDHHDAHCAATLTCAATGATALTCVSPGTGMYAHNCLSYSHGYQCTRFDILFRTITVTYHQTHIYMYTLASLQKSNPDAKPIFPYTPFTDDSVCYSGESEEYYHSL